MPSAELRVPADQKLIASIYDAALSPELWPEVLGAVAAAVGAVGVGYIVCDKRTGRVDWVTLTGPSADKTADYARYYAAFDAYRPILDAAPSATWVRLAECLPDSALRRNAWYNEYVLGCGIADIVGARLFDTDSHSAVFGIQTAIRRPPLTAADLRQLDELFPTVAKAARLQHDLAGLATKSAVARAALDQLAAGVIVSDGSGRIIEMNRAAEQILRVDDGLTARNGQVCARRVFEAGKLARLIAAAAAPKTTVSAGRMLVARHSGKASYVLTVVPIRGVGALERGPLALILVVDQEQPDVSAHDLSDLFGLTRAESRLAAALMDGRKLHDIAAGSGLKITTLRTQLRSVLKKVGVQRQADLARVLSTVRGVRSDPG